MSPVPSVFTNTAESEPATSPEETWTGPSRLDGTRRIRPPRLHRLRREVAANFTHTAAASIATKIPRRTFVRRLGQAGLGLGLSLGALGLESTSPAGASGSCSGGACGPSPLCPYTDCSLDHCYGSHAQVRSYNTFTCQGGNNCWGEAWKCCCKNPGAYSCCDCCASDAGGSNCTTGCRSGYKACICRRKTSSLCNPC
jgi:hypothetical protein